MRPAIIYLGRRLLDASSSLPEGHDEPDQTRQPRRSRLPFCLALLRVGFTKPDKSPCLLVSSYLTVSPLPATPRYEATQAVCFLLHFP